MPLYTFQCPACQRTETGFRKIAERDHLPACECKPGGRGFYPMTRILEAPMVVPDISAYQAVAVDVATGRPPVINSRSAHRDFLKRNGYTEVGNEKVGRKPGEVRGDFNLRKELTQATREVLRKKS